MPLLNEEELERFRTKSCHKVRSNHCDFGWERCNYCHDTLWVRRSPFSYRDLPAAAAAAAAAATADAAAAAGVEAATTSTGKIAVLRYLPILCSRVAATETTEAEGFRASPAASLQSGSVPAPVAAKTDKPATTTTLPAAKTVGTTAGGRPCTSSCIFSHSLDEINYHPLVYKRAVCPAFNGGSSNTSTCAVYYCHKVHGHLEERTPRLFLLLYKPSSAAAAATTAAAAAAFSPLVLPGEWAGASLVFRNILQKPHSTGVYRLGGISHRQQQQPKQQKQHHLWHQRRVSRTRAGDSAGDHFGNAMLQSRCSSSRTTITRTVVCRANAPRQQQQEQQPQQKKQQLLLLQRRSSVGAVKVCEVGAVAHRAGGRRETLPFQVAAAAQTETRAVTRASGSLSLPGTPYSPAAPAGGAIRSPHITELSSVCVTVLGEDALSEHTHHHQQQQKQLQQECTRTEGFWEQVELLGNHATLLQQQQRERQQQETQEEEEQQQLLVGLPLSLTAGNAAEAAVGETGAEERSSQLTGAAAAAWTTHARTVAAAAAPAAGVGLQNPTFSASLQSDNVLSTMQLTQTSRCSGRTTNNNSSNDNRKSHTSKCKNNNSSNINSNSSNRNSICCERCSNSSFCWPAYSCESCSCSTQQQHEQQQQRLSLPHAWSWQPLSSRGLRLQLQVQHISQAESAACPTRQPAVPAAAAQDHAVIPAATTAAAKTPLPFVLKSPLASPIRFLPLNAAAAAAAASAAAAAAAVAPGPEQGRAPLTPRSRKGDPLQHLHENKEFVASSIAVAKEIAAGEAAATPEKPKGAGTAAEDTAAARAAARVAELYWPQQLQPQLNNLFTKEIHSCTTGGGNNSTHCSISSKRTNSSSSSSQSTKNSSRGAREELLWADISPPERQRESENLFKSRREVSRSRSSRRLFVRSSGPLELSAFSGKQWQQQWRRRKERQRRWQQQHKRTLSRWPRAPKTESSLLLLVQQQTLKLILRGQELIASLQQQQQEQNKTANELHMEVEVALEEGAAAGSGPYGNAGKASSSSVAAGVSHEAVVQQPQQERTRQQLLPLLLQENINLRHFYVAICQSATNAQPAAADVTHAASAAAARGSSKGCRERKLRRYQRPTRIPSGSNSS